MVCTSAIAKSVGAVTLIFCLAGMAAQWSACPTERTDPEDG